MATRDPLTLALVYGSTREGRLCDTLVNWAVEQIRDLPDFALQVIDPRDFAVPADFPNTATDSVRQLHNRLTKADAFLVVTPEYNHSFPAILKQVIDISSAAWKAKPVAFLSYGGVSGGLRAVEQLRLVYAELHAVTVRNVVSIINAGDKFDAHGRWQSEEQKARAEKRLAQQMAVLGWWAKSLKAGRRLPEFAAVS